METNEVELRSKTARAKIRLLDYETRIERAGRALAGIFKELRDDQQKPYLLQGYASFEDYCERRWGMTRQRAWQMMTAENVRAQLAGVPETAEAANHLNERQLREIAKVEPTKRAEVLKAASRIKRGAPASAIKQAKAQIIDATTGLPEPLKLDAAEREREGHRNPWDKTDRCPTCGAPVTHHFTTTSSQDT